MFSSENIRDKKVSARSYSDETEFVIGGLASLAFCVMAQVTAHEGYKSGSFSRMGSMTSSIFDLSVITGLGTTFPPAKSFPSRKCTPSMGKEERTPTVTGPEIKSDVRKNMKGNINDATFTTLK